MYSVTTHSADCVPPQGNLVVAVDAARNQAGQRIGCEVDLRLDDGPSAADHLVDDHVVDVIAAVPQLEIERCGFDWVNAVDVPALHPPWATHNPLGAQLCAGFGRVTHPPQRLGRERWEIVGNCWGGKGGMSPGTEPLPRDILHSKKSLICSRNSTGVSGILQTTGQTVARITQCNRARTTRRLY
jgi:hypothetical protein